MTLLAEILVKDGDVGNNVPVWLNFLTKHQFLDNTIGQWLSLLGIILGVMIGGKIIAFILLHHSKKMDAIEDRFIITSMFAKSIAKPLPMALLGLGLLWGGKLLTMEPAIRDYYDKAARTILCIGVIWFIFKIVDIVEVFLKHITNKTATTLDDQLVPLVRKSLRILIIIMGFLYVATNVYDKNMGTILAGLGIGGLAFALAAKDMLANLFGSGTIFTDRPFAIGDRVKIKGYDGVVEEVGFRSTRLRLLNGHLTIIPNAVVANETVENVSRRPFLKRILDITVTYDTSPEKIKLGLTIIREMLEARVSNFHKDNPSRVNFTEFNADSLSIQVIYWFTPAKWWDYLAFNHDFNMELLQRFNDEGIEFAFPTQTLYVKHDSPIEASLKTITKQDD